MQSQGREFMAPIRQPISPRQTLEEDGIERNLKTSP